MVHHTDDDGHAVGKELRYACRQPRTVLLKLSLSRGSLLSLTDKYLVLYIMTLGLNAMHGKSTQ